MLLASLVLRAVTWWRHQMETFSALLATCAGNSPVPVNSPHKGQWRGALMFYLICVWINSWVNNGEAGDLRRYRSHYDFTVMNLLTKVRWCRALVFSCYRWFETPWRSCDTVKKYRNSIDYWKHAIVLLGIGTGRNGEIRNLFIPRSLWNLTHYSGGTSERPTRLKTHSYEITQSFHKLHRRMIVSNIYGCLSICFE